MLGAELPSFWGKNSMQVQVTLGRGNLVRLRLGLCKPHFCLASYSFLGSVHLGHCSATAWLEGEKGLPPYLLWSPCSWEHHLAMLLCQSGDSSLLWQQPQPVCSFHSLQNHPSLAFRFYSTMESGTCLGPRWQEPSGGLRDPSTNGQD